MKPVTVKAGQTVNIEANYIAEPEPTMVWSFEGKEITADEKNSMTLTPKTVKLVILNSKRSDTGKYSIRLTNGSGFDTASVDVIVLCKILINKIIIFKIKI